VEHRLPSEQPTERDSVEAAGELARRFSHGPIPDLDAVRPSQLVQVDVRLSNLRGDPVVLLSAAIRAAIDHVLESRVDRDVEPAPGAA
jgi:hypothetical protein